MWPSPFHNTWESNEDFMNGPIPADQFNTGTYWDDTWNSPPGQWYEPGSALQEPIFGAESDDFGGKGAGYYEKQGRKAAELGLARNPYKRGSWQHASWDDGWYENAGAYHEESISFGSTGWYDNLPSEEDRFHADEVELGRKKRGRGRSRRPSTVILPGGREERMKKVKVKRGKKNGTVKVAVKTGFPHQVERRAVTRAKRVLRSKGYRGVSTQATMWFPIITPIGPIPYNYKGYTPVLVHFKFNSKRSTAPSRPSRRPSRRAPAPARDVLRDAYYEEEEGGFYEEDLAPSGGGDWGITQDSDSGDFPQGVPEVESGTFDQYFGLDLLDDVDQGNEFLVED